jgi:tetratricopeptide (TPR) repeat protein
MRYPQANAHFRQATQELDRYPEALQALFRPIAVTAAIEAKDGPFAREMLQGLEKIDARYRIPHLQQLLAGRLAEIQGRNAEAFHAYSLATDSRDRAIEAEARFGRTVTGLAEGKIALEDARSEFETLSTIWRRTEVEVKALEALGEMYAKDGRWREAFLTAQRASQIMPDHPATRRLEDAMGRRFENLFLDNEADKLPKVEALALYQEFRSLMPVGRRGDEIARRLADRLHELDLVNEAAEILEHQVKNRLEGVARASVATRLAVMHLQNRQPAKALTVLRGTRLSTLPEDLRRARSLLEARALGELFRTDLAIEVLANDKGEDVERLRADIYWKGKRWREAGESYERVLGDAWQSAEPLNASQRLDGLRAGLAYVLGDEKLSLDRLRGRYLAKMDQSVDSGAFRLIAADNLTRPQAFRDVARAVVSADTMTEFMASYRKRYPETAGAARPVRSAGDGRQSGLDRRDPTQALPPGNG